MTAYRLPPAHRRKILRMRAVLDDPSRTREVHASAQEYLTLHASCEAFLRAVEAGTVPAERPRCGQGFGKRAKVTAPVPTVVCPVCNKQRAVISFDDALGKCIKCKYKPSEGKKGRREPKPENPGSSRRRKCPVCLQTVTVKLVAGDWTVQPHDKQTSEGRVECRAAGTVIAHERRDAMDYRAPGSFEGGKRR